MKSSGYRGRVTPEPIPYARAKCLRILVDRQRVGLGRRSTRRAQTEGTAAPSGATPWLTTAQLWTGTGGESPNLGPFADARDPRDP